MNQYITIHPSVIIWLSVLFYLQPPVVLPFLWAAGLHELGHFLVLKKIGKQPKHLTITFSGAKMETPLLNNCETLLSSAAGPAISLFLVLLFPLFPVISAYSLILGLFNLLPLPGLDGWHILNSSFALIFQTKNVETFSYFISLCTAGIFVILSYILSEKYRLGLWPMVVGLVYLIRAIQNYRTLSTCEFSRWLI